MHRADFHANLVARQHELRAPRFPADHERRSHDALDRALDAVPAYHPWRRFDAGRTAPADERYAALPVLTKATMRAVGPSGLVPADRDLATALATGEVELVETSGTTTEHVTNVWCQSWWDASETASWKLNAATAGLAPSPRSAELTSARNVGVLSTGDLPIEARRLGHLLFLNEKATAREWSRFHHERMLTELDGFAPAVLEANPSYLARLAWWALDHGRRPRDPEVVILTYELPSLLHLRAIRSAFDAPVCSSYGSTEVGYAFMECEHGKLHQNLEFCRVDFEPLAPPLGTADVGRILVTTFGNPWAKMVRFDVGDLVRLDPTQSCPCGRDAGWILEAIEGRTANVTFALDGRVVTTRRVDQALAAVDAVRDYQLVQLTAGEYHVSVVTRDGARGFETGCVAALRKIYGDSARVEIERAADLEATPSGKYRRTRSDWQSAPGDLFA